MVSTTDARSRHFPTCARPPTPLEPSLATPPPEPSPGCSCLPLPRRAARPYVGPCCSPPPPHVGPCCSPPPPRAGQCCSPPPPPPTVLLLLAPPPPPVVLLMLGPFARHQPRELRPPPATEAPATGHLDAPGSVAAHVADVAAGVAAVGVVAMEPVVAIHAYPGEIDSVWYFEVDRNGDGQKTTIAKNILRYLPVLPRIQRLFMTKDTAQQMRWVVEGNRYTDKMIHPSDGTAWKNFVKKFPLKAGDPRSVAVAISTDGFNPYGPKYPGKNMNVYLEPLVDDLVRGWEGRGIRTYDASKKYFDMYVWYHTSLHDLSARALFCGWCTHGKWPCPQCRQAVTFFWLNKGGKYSCFDEARQFLERRHAYRSDVKSFKKGRVVRGPKPILKTETEIKAELDALQPSPDGNGFLGYGETHQWTHKPCLWKLPYFEFLELPHNIDVMHTEKNISEAIWSTIVDTEKTKDNIKARIDQEMWCDRPELNMQPPHGAKKLGLSHTLRSASQRPKKGRSSNG
ncbi:hypothetical protein QYE76_069484 [Lolium multiflorum]|uniref:Uncharacterized protein n=1 Tax=Lolium multiflorum TaxID=4521 RepID=A0AAD8WEY4_LOLMU|nr:hypothetical protein QYE76_069484 [Lolium multiflorum]